MKRVLLFFFLSITISLLSQETKKKGSIPKKWNTTTKVTFILNQSTFSNWVAGGTNTVAGNVNINCEFNYKKGKWNWDNKITSAYGLSYIDG